MEIADIRSIPLFDGLTDDHLAELVAAGTEVPIVPGVELFRAGEHADHWWVLVDGALDLLRHIGREQVAVGRMDVPGQWAGGFRAWDEHGVYLATGRGVATGRLLQVPAGALRSRSSAWFPFGAHLIEGLFRTARAIESTARQRESLVTLGTLAAGLAHEINNPTAAAARAVDSLDDACRTLQSSLADLARGGLTAAQFTALDGLRRSLVPRPPGADPLDVADAEEALAAWLARHGVERGWVLAQTLAAAGADVAWCEQAAAEIGSAALPAGLEWVTSTFSVVTLIGEVKESTRRVSDLVGAVRSYSQMDRGSLQEIDVTEGIESTLVMLSNKLRGVEVVRAFDPGLPRIEAYAGELNQVWTNLIDNAVDAMAGTGTLQLTTRTQDADVVVEVSDTGPGMPPEVAARAFEAFYSTKDVGKGTGLGLDIARRIVEDRHGGVISIHASSDGTTMRVVLPVRPPESRRRDAG